MVHILQGRSESLVKPAAPTLTLQCFVYGPCPAVSLLLLHPVPVSCSPKSQAPQTIHNPTGPHRHHHGLARTPALNPSEHGSLKFTLRWTRPSTQEEGQGNESHVGTKVCTRCPRRPPLPPRCLSLPPCPPLLFSLSLSSLSSLSLCSPRGSTKAGSRTLTAFLGFTMRRRNQKEAERMNSHPGGPLDQEASVEREQGEAREK